MKIFRITNAFSLVEILISFIIVSALLAAFAPVITKRIKPSINTVSSSTNFTPNCSEPFSDYCLLCDGTKECILCTITCSSGTYMDSKQCTCKFCDSIDPNCTSCTPDDAVCTSCADGYSLQDNTCTPCPPGTYCTGGTQTPCEDGFYCPDGKSHLSCESKTEHCATCDAISGDCSGCAATFSWNGTNCVSSCPSHCLECSSSTNCSKCATGFQKACGYCFNKCPTNYYYISCNVSDSNGPYITCGKKGTYSGTVYALFGSFSCLYRPDPIKVYPDGDTVADEDYGHNGVDCSSESASCSSETDGASCTATD